MTHGSGYSISGMLERNMDPTEASISEMDIGFDTHLAWIASNANLSMMPPGVDCNGRGWVMGTGASAIACAMMDGTGVPTTGCLVFQKEAPK